MPNMLRIAVAGNPNAGKTSVFNFMTGSTQQTGNWTGVTVSKTSGLAKIDDVPVEVVDLPGTYSLSAYSEDELVARDYIIKEHPDVVVNIVDATALEHNLFLTLQIIELGVPMVIGLNMADEAQKQGLKIDIGRLSKILGVPVISTVGTTGKGIKELLEIASDVAKSHEKSSYLVDYGKDIEESTRKIQITLLETEVARTNYPLHFFAHKLLEGDKQIEKELDLIGHPEKVHEIVKFEMGRLSAIYGSDVETLVADRRYTEANRIAKLVTKGNLSRTLSIDRADNVLTHRIWGFAIFAVVLFGIFFVTFTLSAPISNWIGQGMSWLGQTISSLFPIAWLQSFIKSVLVDGFGGVLGFFPNIMILFILISLIEDSGYMARIAFIMDGIMSKVGLSGKAFIPFIVSFGCTVPGIMATRALDSKRERILTILTAPLISCSARMEVFFFLASVFFVGVLAQTLVVWSVFAIGALLAVGLVSFFSMVYFKNQPPTPLLIELPPYRLPTIRNVGIKTWDRAKHFFKRATGVILIGSILFWILSNIPWGYAIEGTVIGWIGHKLEFLIVPLGLDWRAVVALMFGFVAKEVVVAVFGQIGGFDPQKGSKTVMGSWYTIPAVMGLMVFINLYTPCLATLAMIKAEAGWRWMWVSIIYGLVLAWLMAFTIFQVGSLFL